MRVARRTFMRGLLGTSVMGMGGIACSAPRPVGGGNPPAPTPQASAIQHIVVLTFENRSFDHFLGWLPNAEGWLTKDPGLTYTNSSGQSYAPQNLRGDYTGCGHPVPNSAYGAPNQTAYNGGKMDGFLRVPGNDTYSIGYYLGAGDAFPGAFAQSYTVCDHWFAPILAETFPNRMFYGRRKRTG